MKTSVKKLIYVIAVLFIPIIALYIFKHFPNAVEEIYSDSIYVGISAFFHFLFSWIPFSVGDFFYMLAVGILTYQFVKLLLYLLKRKFENALKRFLLLFILLQSGWLAFHLFWGMNYYRLPAAQRLALPRADYSLEQLKTAAIYSIEKANFYRSKIDSSKNNMSNADIYRLAQKSYLKKGETQVDYHIYRPKLKPSILTPLLNYMGVSGYFNPFTGEAQLNYAMPLTLKPFVACHELAHQAGFGFEDEANFVGFYIASNSGNNFFAYSAYNRAVVQLLRAIAFQSVDEYKKLIPLISEKVLNDYKEISLYWSSYTGFIDSVSNIFYDSYLKANNQPAGLATYNRMTLLLMAYYQKTGVLQKEKT